MCNFCLIKNYGTKVAKDREKIDKTLSKKEKEKYYLLNTSVWKILIDLFVSLSLSREGENEREKGKK